MRIAIPVAESLLARHFGHAGEFQVFETDEESILAQESIQPPPHAPGVLPAFLKEHAVDTVIAGGMGRRAIGLFTEQGINVVVGAEPLAPAEVVRKFLAGELEFGVNVCDH